MKALFAAVHESQALSDRYCGERECPLLGEQRPRSFNVRRRCVVLRTAHKDRQILEQSADLLQSLRPARAQESASAPRPGPSALFAGHRAGEAGKNQRGSMLDARARPRRSGARKARHLFRPSACTKLAGSGRPNWTSVSGDAKVFRRATVWSV